MNVPNLPLVYERHLRAEDAKSGWRRDRLHSSDLGAMTPGEGCPRQIWLRVHGAYSRQATPGELLMFARANEIHVSMAKILQERLPIEYPGWSVIAIEEADGEHDGEARLDMLLQDPEGGKWIVDVKSKRGRAFEYGNVFTERARLQTADYGRRWKTEGQIILATDREGSHFVQQAVYPRDDAAVIQAWAALRAMSSSPEPPPVLAPVATLKATKTKGEAVTLDLPWPCKYCAFYKISCEGALPEWVCNKVVGHHDPASGAFAPAPGREALAPVAEAALAVALAKRDGGLPAESGEAGAGQAAEGGGQGGAETDELKGEAE